MKKGKLKKFWKISIFIIILLSLLYIFQISNLTFNAYQLTLLKKDTKILNEENSTLQLKITSKQSILEIDKLAKDLNFEKISRIQYIKAKGAVAEK